MVDKHNIPSETVPGIALCTGYIGMGTVVEKDHFLCDQGTAFPPDGIPQVPHCCAIAVCIHSCPVVQELKEKIALCIPICHQYLPCRELGLDFFFMEDVVCFHSSDAAFNVSVKQQTHVLFMVMI
jgi:hypothetical protein